MRTEIKIYIGISIILMIDLILYLTLRVSFTGNLIDRILFWIWFIGTFYIVFRFIRKKWARIYGFVLIILVGLSLLPMMIPILTVAAFAVGEENSIKIDNEIRIFETAKSVIGKPYIAAAKNYWLLEREIGETDFDFEIEGKFYRIDDAKSINRLPESDSGKISLEFEFENGKVIKEL
ncbi:hypothetical protein [Tenacibaculum sp. 190524A02b]|uniref:hypothetical protein n=1 Tax=Tenacibaculum vairaonense TaxID=3137860 RepID=UPI0031FAFAC6